MLISISKLNSSLLNLKHFSPLPIPVMADAIKYTNVDLGAEILAICGTMVGFATAVTAIRIAVRVRIVKRIGAEDYFIVVASVSITQLPVSNSEGSMRLRSTGANSVSYQVLMFVEMMVIIPQVAFGAGRHVQYIEPPSNITNGLRLNFVTQPLCLLALCLTKISVGTLLLSIKPFLIYKRIFQGLIAFAVVSSIANLGMWCFLSPANILLGTCID